MALQLSQRLTDLQDQVGSTLITLSQLNDSLDDLREQEDDVLGQLEECCRHPTTLTLPELGEQPEREWLCGVCYTVVTQEGVITQHDEWPLASWRRGRVYPNPGGATPGDGGGDTSSRGSDLEASSPRSEES